MRDHDQWRRWKRINRGKLPIVTSGFHMFAPTCAQMPSYTKGMHTYTCIPPHTHTKGKNQSLHYLCVDFSFKECYYNRLFFFSSSRLAAHSFARGQENSFYKTITEERHAWRKLINLEAGKGWKIAVRARELLLPGRWRLLWERGTGVG